ncbi:toll-interacting protein-like [Tropilaelaps mercedesae]|uniref:Toll-interacting protein-like n=1 Tax=Tropilaelaps mercedesae TaxID=418985 RepID=A0A1V9X4P2_9ACAR|nr:toll-interacting protein-like [Tropilaelaps mercedesae]
MMGFVFLPYFCGTPEQRPRLRRFEFFAEKKKSWPSFFEPTRVFIGELPDDFLRLDPIVISQANNGDSSRTVPQQGLSPDSVRARQIALDEQTAVAMQRQMDQMLTAAAPIGRLTLTVVEARLVKNYGMTRMDPYVRLRIGHNIYETHTHYNGAKNPRWDKAFHCFIPPGVTGFVIEIFDECAFTASEKIAWAYVPIPEAVLTCGETQEEWVPLNGKQGDAKEGAINIVMSYTLIPRGAVLAPQVMYLNGNPVPTTAFGFGPAVRPVAATVMPGVVSVQPETAVGSPTATSTPASIQTPVGLVGGQQVVQSIQPPPPPKITDNDIKQLQEMFPSIERPVIESVLESHRGNKNLAISDLLLLVE